MPRIVLQKSSGEVLRTSSGILCVDTGSSVSVGLTTAVTMRSIFYPQTSFIEYGGRTVYCGSDGKFYDFLWTNSNEVMAWVTTITPGVTAGNALYWVLRIEGFWYFQGTPTSKGFVQAKLSTLSMFGNYSLDTYDENADFTKGAGWSVAS
jgi:hypothetical protein